MNLYKMYFQAMEDVRNVLKRWPCLSAIATDCELSKAAVEQWIKRKVIPANRASTLVRSARKHGIKGITLAFLSKYHKRPSKKAQD